MVSLRRERVRREARRFERLDAIDRPASVRAIEVDRLARELRTRVRGEVRFDAGSRALYATDGSNYRHTPIGVVIPRDRSDVITTVGASESDPLFWTVTLSEADVELFPAASYALATIV